MHSFSEKEGDFLPVQRTTDYAVRRLPERAVNTTSMMDSCVNEHRSNTPSSMTRTANASDAMTITHGLQQGASRFQLGLKLVIFFQRDL